MKKFLITSLLLFFLIAPNFAFAGTLINCGESSDPACNGSTDGYICQCDNNNTKPAEDTTNCNQMCNEIPAIPATSTSKVDPTTSVNQTCTSDKNCPEGKTCSQGVCLTVYKVPDFLNVGDRNPSIVIGRIVKFLIGIAGTIALIFFIYGGTLWIFSGGKEEMVKKGRDTMLWSAIGWIFIAVSYYLVNIVFGVLGQ